MKYIIDKNSDKIILKAFLKEKLSLSSRLIKSLKKYYDGILVNGEHADVNRVLYENDILELDFSDRDDDINEYLVKTEIPLDIIYEDENITVVNKIANMPTHPSINHHTDTLANALAFRYRDKPYVFRAINRLDKNTSGIVLTANNKLYAEILASKLRNDLFTKEYIAIVEGKLSECGRIEAPIKRQDESIIKREVGAEGEYALTEYETLLFCDEISVLRVRPVTGRTHQIRVHMKHIGHSILGDDLYGRSSELTKRQALHAYKLKIDGIGEYTAPLPDDMKKVIRSYFKDDEIFW